MQFTENKTTAAHGQCRATCLARTVAPSSGHEIITWELMYPRYIHAELMTHRAFSRNAASSRATPLRVTLEEVRKRPAFFSYVGANRPGMVAGEELTGVDLEQFHAEWNYLAEYVAGRVEGMSARYGIHKQTLNRALEPWLFIRTIVTATDTENFFRLRLAPDAQPEMQDLARCMFESMTKAEAKSSDFHFPYFDGSTTPRDELVIRNVAAAARVCVMQHDGKPSPFEQDADLVRRLLDGWHLTPFEHFAIAGSHGVRYANLTGWISMRFSIEDAGLKNPFIAELLGL